MTIPMPRPIILTRPAVRSGWNPVQWNGPCRTMTLRDWEAAIASCTLDESNRDLLAEALLQRAAPACQKRQTRRVPRHVELHTRSFLAYTGPERLRELVIEELADIWQVLDLDPDEGIPGMLRGLVLVCFGIRLRQVLTTLEKKPGGQPLNVELRAALTELGWQEPPLPEQQPGVPAWYGVLVQHRREVARRERHGCWWKFFF